MSVLEISRPSAELRPMRLTVRGRRVLASLVGLLLALGIGWASVSGATASDERGASASYVQVYAGQSLWQVAQRVAPQSNTGDVVADLITANHLTTDVVQPGTRLLIPSSVK